MMLKTSSRSINPFWRMFTFTLRKSVGIIIMLCIAALLYCPGSYISIISNTMIGINSIAYTFIFAEFIAFFAGAIAVGFNIINFTFLYKKSAGDVFHAFPLTRCELLVSRAIAGVTATIIPVLLAYVSFGILIAFNPWLGNLSMLALCFLNTLLIVLVCSSFSLIFVVCAGNMFDLAVSLVGVNIAVMLIGNVFTETLSGTLWGFPNNYSFNILYNLSVPYFCYRGITDLYSITEIGINSAFIEFYIRSVIYIAVFSVVAVLLYKYRKAEKGGAAYAYKFMYLICSMLAGICGGYIIGIVFGYEPHEMGYYAFMTIGALLCSTLYGAVSNRGFKQVWRSVAMGGIAAILSIGVAVIGITGAFGYSNRVPTADDISEVVVTVANETAVFKEPQKVLALHNDIIKNNSSNKKYYVGDRIAFDYKLKNGKTLSREFYLDINDIKDTAFAVYTSQERVDAYIEKINSSESDYITFDYSETEGDGGTLLLTKMEAIAFLKAYEKDLANCDESILFEQWENIYHFSNIYENDTSDETHFSFEIMEFESFTYIQQYMTQSGILEK